MPVRNGPGNDKRYFKVTCFSKLQGKFLFSEQFVDQSEPCFYPFSRNDARRLQKDNILSQKIFHNTCFIVTDQ